MKEELLIERKFGKQKPFNVPDGYFDTFRSDIMARLPLAVSAKKRPVTRILRPVTWAACIAVAFIVTGVCLSGIFRNTGKRIANVSQVEMSQQASNDYLIDELSDYAMMDNDDFYSFIADD